MKRNILLFSLIFLGLILIIIFYSIFEIKVNRRFINYFYYNNNYTKLIKEKRIVVWNNLNKKNIENYIIKDFLLGPTDYRLKLPSKDYIDLNGVYISQKNNLIIIDLKLITNIDKINEYDFKLFLDSLIKTMKENTKYRFMLILLNGKWTDITIDNYDLKYPLVIN